MNLNEKLDVARNALKRIALNIYGDAVPQVVAGDALQKIDAIATESAPATEVAIPDALDLASADVLRLEQELETAVKRAEAAEAALEAERNLVKMQRQALDITRETKEVAALTQRAAGELPNDGVHWDLFPAFLIDHHERDVIYEESMQGWVVEMLKDENYKRVAQDRAILAARAVGGADELKEWRDLSRDEVRHIIRKWEHVGEDGMGLFRRFKQAAAAPFDNDTWATAMEFAANLIELYDDATMREGNHMLSSTECSEIILALRSFGITRAPVGDGDEREIARKARNQVVIDGHLNAALDAIMQSSSPDGKFCILGTLVDQAIRAALTQQKGGQA